MKERIEMVHVVFTVPATEARDAIMCAHKAGREARCYWDTRENTFDPDTCFGASESHPDNNEMTWWYDESDFVEVEV
jgi:hypothetical protein